MAKAKFDYATENVVRRGDELAQYSAKPADAVHLVMVRRFDPARLELGSWVQASEHTQNETKAQEQFTFIADHMRSEGALSVVWVQVNNWHPVTNPEYKIGKYNCTGTIRDVRSSAMLQADGGVPRNVALDAIGLAIAVNHAMAEWIDSQSQTGDDAAKDQRDAGLPPVESKPGPTFFHEILNDSLPGGSQFDATKPAVSDSNGTGETDGHENPMHAMADPPAKRKKAHK